MNQLQVWIIVAKLIVGTAVVDGEHAYTTRARCDQGADAFAKKIVIARDLLDCRAIPVDPQ